MRPPTKRWPWLLIIPLILLAGVLEESLYNQNLRRDPKTGEIMRLHTGLPQTLFRPIYPWRPGLEGANVKQDLPVFNSALFGMKSALADILWVKCDSFFHTGRYDKIMPLCYLITWLNPKFLEVYSIGAWHMAYNFMDRRYIPEGVKFLERGIHNNPEDPELRFEQGHILDDKAQEFGKAATRYQEANKLGLKPAGKRHALAHALEGDGQIDAAVKAWDVLIAEEQAANNWVMQQVSKHNRDLTVWRIEDRKHRAEHPLVVNFDYKWSVPKPRVLRLSGATNLPEYTRVNVCVRDKGYEDMAHQHLDISWRVSNLTLFWDNFVVGKDGKWASFSKPGKQEMDRIDMTSEPAKYPLKSQEYEVILTINPRVEPIQVQDLTSWSGEGVTGPNVTTVDGVRMVRKVFTVTREQLLGEKKVALLP